MPTISDIASGSNYLGSSPLGGGSLGSIDIDTRPIQQLAQYTYLYNRSQYDQRQKDADEKIKELAKLTAYDLANARGKDKDAAIKALADLQKFGAEFAAQGTPKTPTEKIKQQIEYQNKIQGAEDTINSINARGIGYNARKNAILKSETDATLKDIQLKQLDEEFDNTDIYTPIAAEPKFDLTVPKVGAPVYKQTEVVVEGANGVVSETLKFFDPVANKNASFLEVNDLDIEPFPSNATAAQKNEYAQRATKKSGNKIWQDAAVALNAAMKDPKYQEFLPSAEIGNQTGVDFEAIKNDNPVLGNTLGLIERYNTYAKQRKQDAVNGYYTDKIGNKVKLVQNVRPEDWQLIDITKPISAVDMVYLQKFADAAPDTKEEKYQYTGAADRVKLEQIQQAGQNERARISARASGSGGGGSTKKEEVIDKPAILFGQHIQRLKDRFEQNGGKDVPVPFKQVDEKTRIAAKLSEGDIIVYRPDGSYVVLAEDQKTQKSVGTIENLAQGFIDAVKTIDLADGGKDGAMAEGFQTKSEAKLKELFGTTSGKLIWDNWDVKAATPNAEATQTEATKPAGKIMSNAEFEAWKKSKGL